MVIYDQAPFEGSSGQRKARKERIRAEVVSLRLDNPIDHSMHTAVLCAYGALQPCSLLPSKVLASYFIARIDDVFHASQVHLLSRKKALAQHITRESFAGQFFDCSCGKRGFCAIPQGKAYLISTSLARRKLES